jgi:hypothetical protein
MARWFLSRIVGDGGEHDPLRAAVGDKPGVLAYVAQIPSLPNGLPRRTWALCHVEAEDYDALLDQDVIALPDLAHDQLLGAAPASARGRVAATVRATWGRDPDVSPGRSMRDLLHDIGRRDEPHFDADEFGVRP